MADLTRLVSRLALAFVFAIAGATLLVWACGPFIEDLPTAATISPMDVERYARGELGLVRPTYARRYLIHAYRVLSGRQPHAEALYRPIQIRPAPPGPPTRPRSPFDDWAQASRRVLGVEPTAVDPYGRAIDFSRPVPGVDYQNFSNCLEDTFDTALRTLNEREARFGAASAELRDWTQAQVAVFDNCSNRALVLPAALAPTANPLLRADRDYQTAAAYFYAMQYDEAAKRFSAIAQDQVSPWRPYGRYLTARARIRQATLAPDDDPRRDGLFTQADAELRAALADPAAAVVHASARGLQHLVEDRHRPIERLRVLSTALASGPSATEQDFEDYTRLMDRFVGNTVTYEYTGVASLNDLVAVNDASDWVLALQGSGAAAGERAVQRWQTTRSLPWLVAALWKIPATHVSVPAVLEAARVIDAKSPAYATVSFLQVRLLAEGGQRADARALLETLPTTPQPGFDAEALNFIRAERLMLADTFEEFLANAPRMTGSDRFTPPAIRGAVVLDEDAGDVFTYHLPLDRLIEGARSSLLPTRTRIRVASAALARAIVFRREDTGIQAATALRQVAPVALHADLDRYIAAANADDRHRTGILLLLRTPGMHAYVLGLEDEVSFERPDPDRRFDHTFRRNWWCVSEEGRIGRAWGSEQGSALVPLLYREQKFSAAAFLRPEEVAAADREVGQLRALGTARDYLADEALKWALARPTDLEAAEALAQVVEGGRWTDCGAYESRGPSTTLSRRAFQTLHKLFPKSEWARRTKYWYE